MRNAFIYKELRKIRAELTELNLKIKGLRKDPVEVDVNDLESFLISIPSHLHKTFLLLIKLNKKVTATEMGKILGISRPTASSKLNRLVDMKFTNVIKELEKGHLNRPRALFYISNPPYKRVEKNG